MNIFLERDGSSESTEHIYNFPIVFSKTPCMTQSFVDGGGSGVYYREMARAISNTQYRRNGYYAQQLIVRGY